MTSDCRVAVSSRSSGEIRRTAYDLGIFTVGYESRATFAAKTLGQRCRIRAAIGFAENRVKAYYPNLRWFSANDYIVTECGDAAFEEPMSLLLDRLRASGAERHTVLVDISSMTRVRLAKVIALLSRFSAPVDVDLVYSPARFSFPKGEDGPIVSAGPVLPMFAGWSSNPDAGAVAVVGVGYEPRRAAGIVEFIEPAEVWAFVPIGTDRRFRKSIEKSNSDLWALVKTERILEYRIGEPYQTFLSLESLSSRLRDRAQPVLVPFGPKIFNLCCLLVALSQVNDIAVWRVSSGKYQPPQERRANGELVAIRASFSDGAPTTTAEK